MTVSTRDAQDGSNHHCCAEKRNFPVRQVFDKVRPSFRQDEQVVGKPFANLRDQRDLAISAPALGKFESRELIRVVVGKMLSHCGQKGLFYAQLSSTRSAQVGKQMVEAGEVKIRQTIDLLVAGAKTKSVGRSTLASKLSF